MLKDFWQELDLGKFITLQRGYDLPQSARKVGSVPVITSSGVSDTHSEARVPGPGVVTGRYGTIGEVFFIREDFWPLNTTLFVKDFRGNNPLYVSYMLQTIDFHSHSGKSGVPGVNRNDLHKLRVRVPKSIFEQRAIAEALGDVDALIGGLERMIAKKRDLKRAAMQQLLTGQTRLPGFSGEWEVKPLGDAAQIINGGTPRTSVPSYWDGGIKWCTPTDITSCSGKYLIETERTISTDGLASCSARLLPAGSLLLCSRATIGEVRIAGCKICTNQGFKSLICKPGFSNEFLYYKLLTMNSQMIERAIGSTFLEISKKDTAALEILIPPFDEQAAIATVLSDMDEEIQALEKRLAKTRALKQGMMQELLTGKTRLV